MGFSCHSVRTLRVGTKVVGGTVFQAKLWSAAQHKSVESNSIRIAHLIYKSGRYHSSSYEVRPRPAALHKVWEVQKIKSNCTFLPVQVISLGVTDHPDKLYSVACTSHKFGRYGLSRQIVYSVASRSHKFWRYGLSRQTVYSVVSRSHKFWRYNLARQTVLCCQSKP